MYPSFYLYLYWSPPLWPPYICHRTRNWVDQKTFQIHPFSYLSSTENNVQQNVLLLSFIEKYFLFSINMCNGKTRCPHPYRQSRRWSPQPRLLRFVEWTNWGEISPSFPSKTFHFEDYLNFLTQWGFVLSALKISLFWSYLRKRIFVVCVLFVWSILSYVVRTKQVAATLKLHFSWQNQNISENFWKYLVTNLRED